MEKLTIKFESDIKDEHKYDYYTPFTGDYLKRNHPVYYPHACEYPNIYKKVKEQHEVISKEDVIDAVDLITAYFMQTYCKEIVINLDARNNDLAPAKEMTLDEIEKLLGYKVKIVNKGE